MCCAEKLILLPLKLNESIRLPHFIFYSWTYFASFPGVYFLGVDVSLGGENWLGLDSKALR